MALAPAVGASDSLTVARIYQDSELRLLERIADQLQLGIDSDDWEAMQLARLQTLREEVLAELARTNPVAAAEIRRSLADAYARGGAAALADVRGVITDARQLPAASGRAAVAAFAQQIDGGLVDASRSIVRAVDDVVRQVVTQTVAAAITGTITRREAAQATVLDLLGHGLNGIETRRGTLSLSDYAAMAVRTSGQRSAIAGHTATALANGFNLCIIQPGPRPCDICDEWARLILSMDGTPAGEYELSDRVTGGTVEVTVDATIEDALDAGYEHPNCRCGRIIFIPGATDPSVIEREPWDQEGYLAQQQQRSLERDIREAKMAEALALSPEAAASARGDVLAAQAAIREHLAANEFLKRQSDREQV